jgi:hypothetical protein
MNIMLYRDVERVLEMGMTISVEQQHPIFPLLLREIDTIPLDSYHYGRQYYVDLFICGEAASKLSGVLSAYSPTRAGVCDIIRVNAEEMSSASMVMDEIGKIDLAVRGGLYLHDSKIYIDYRISSSAKHDITNLGNLIHRMNNRIRIADLGPGRGGISILDQIDSRIHLAVVSYEADILPETGIPAESDLLLEYNFTMAEEGGFRAIAYGSNSISVVRIKSPFLQEIHTLSIERRIPKASILAKPQDGKYRSFTFLPYSMVDDQISTLFEAKEKFPELDFNLLAIRSYDRGIWDWI